MSPKAVPGKQYDAALHLLDRQLLDPDGELVGKVDDLELSEQDGDLVVSAILTGPAALGNKTIRPFSDFLLHDIGTGDGIVQNGPQEDTVPVQLSTRNKMRTPPLWGVRTRDRLMHDGESLTFLEAIERHERHHGA